MKPSEEIKKAEIRIPLPKIVEGMADVPARLQGTMNAAHTVAKENAQILWDSLVVELSKLKQGYTGDEFLSAFSTCLSALSAHFLFQMHTMIASKDDAGRSLDDLLEGHIFGLRAVAAANKSNLEKTK